MKLPRDLDGADLVRKLKALGYTRTRQRGSHVRVTTQRDGEHHEVVPMHSPLKLGTLRSILRGLSDHHGMTLEELTATLDL